MQLPKKTIVVWQLMVSPHMAGLAKAMADRGWDVHYVASETISADRVNQGWDVPDLGSAELHLLDEPQSACLRLLSIFPEDAVHICQGIRSNGYVSKVQSWLRKRKRTVYVVMETVNDSGMFGFLKRFLYKLNFAYHNNVAGFLAIGYKTPKWIVDRGVSESKVFEFAYFLPVFKVEECDNRYEYKSDTIGNKFKFAFIGRIDKGKRLDLLLDAISQFPSASYELDVVGAGVLHDSVKSHARSLGLDNVNWHGTMPMPEIAKFLREVDCLVLPSDHDGWGAVVSEALLSGARVICSDACGSSGVVHCCLRGSVFKAGQVSELKKSLYSQITFGSVTNSERIEIQSWANLTISSIAGAAYLEELISNNNSCRSIPPWRRAEFINSKFHSKNNSAPR